MWVSHSMLQDGSKGFCHIFVCARCYGVGASLCARRQLALSLARRLVQFVGVVFLAILDVRLPLLSVACSIPYNLYSEVFGMRSAHSYRHIGRLAWHVAAIRRCPEWFCLSVCCKRLSRCPCLRVTCWARAAVRTAIVSRCGKPLKPVLLHAHRRCRLWEVGCASFAQLRWLVKSKAPLSFQIDSVATLSPQARPVRSCRSVCAVLGLIISAVVLVLWGVLLLTLAVLSLSSLA